MSPSLPLGAAFLAVALALPVRAAEVPDLARQYDALESQLRFVEQEYSRPDESQGQRARRKFSEGETQFLLGNWRQATVLLYDALEVPEFRASPDHGTALYYLGESLYQEGEYKPARSWFRQILSTPGAPRQRESFLRALDIAIRTSDAKDVDLLLERGRVAFGDRPPPELVYLAAKAQATRADLDPAERRRRALEAFAAVPAPFQHQAAYWQGAIRVEERELEQAAERFLACTGMPGNDRRQVEVRELCQLALGRVYTELGRTQEAVEHYQEIPRDSPRFEEALYELAWTWVKAKKYEQALRAAALISDLSPDSRMAPEATILQGHLSLKLGRYAEAIEAYDRVINQYAPVRDELDAILGMKEDPVRYFNEILGGAARPGEARPFDAASVLPPVAVRWATKRPDMARALGVVGDLETGRRDLADSRAIADRLDAVLLRNDGLDAFLTLKEGYGRAEAVENGTLWLEGRVLDAEAALAASGLPAEQRAALERTQAPRHALEQRVAVLPRTPEAVQTRQERLRARFAALDKAAFRLGYAIEAAKAQIAGTRSWIEAHRPAGGGAEGQAEVNDEIRQQEETVHGYEQDLAALQQEIARAADAVEGSEGSAAEQALREEYRRALDAESVELAPLRLRGAPEERVKIEELEVVRARLPELLARAGRAQAQLRGQARVGAGNLRARVAVERQGIDEQAGEMTGTQRDAKDLVGRIALDSFRDVRGQFYDLVLKADVGIVDVSWQRKRERLDKIQLLSGEKAGDLAVMDDEYKGVLKEVQ